MTITAYEQDLPPGMSGTAAEQIFMRGLRERWGDDDLREFHGASTESRMIITAPAFAVELLELGALSDELFSGHYGGV